MPSFYRVLQYFPDPLNDERINLAVVAYDDDGAHARVLRDWSRVRAFAQHDVIEILALMPASMRAWTPEQARDFRSSELSSLQLTEPRGSVAPAAELIDRIARRMLVEPRPPPTPAADPREPYDPHVEAL